MLHTILWGLVLLVVVLWLLGLIFHVARGFIHILLIVAAALILFNIFFR